MCAPHRPHEMISEYFENYQSYENKIYHKVKFSVSLLHIVTVILPQTLTELCAFLPAVPVLRSFVQYSN